MSIKKIVTKSPQETQQAAYQLAQQFLGQKPRKKAMVLTLQGDLGTGKTTFLQGFAEGLGIKEKILSPTFIVMKRFKIYNSGFKNFYHIDCYRLNKPQEMLGLGFKEIISNPENIIAIEWSEKIKGILQKNIILITFEHLEENQRRLTIKK